MLWEPISGHVIDAVTGRAVANALVRFQGTGDAGKPGYSAAHPAPDLSDRLNPPSMRGEVRTAPDGSFLLPLLAPGHFEVRVSAPGYIGARQFLNEQPAGYKPPPPRPLPSTFCMARYGRPDCAGPVVLYDGNFALQPTAAELEQMGNAAEAGFGLAKDSPLQVPRFQAAAISDDGTKLALLGPPGGSAVPRPCTGWVYDIAADRLQRIQPELPPKYCDGLTPKMKWEGPTAVLSVSGFVPQPGSLVWETEAMRWQEGTAQVVSVEHRENMPNPGPAGFQAEDNETILDKTDDGEFVVVAVTEDCKQCDQTVVLSRERDWKIQIKDPVFSGFVLDRADDILVTILPGNSEEATRVMTLEVVDLKSRHEKDYSLPPSGPYAHLLAMQPLGDGRLSVAYTTQGECDPFGPAAPFAPAAGQPMPMPRQSMCFVVLPLPVNTSAQGSAPPTNQ